jgi:metal-responsive CopG/Arc/MetJ family transcriptional regulator
MVKTTIDIRDELWKKFSIKVIEEYGGRKKNDVITDLIQQWVNQQITKRRNGEK